MKTVIFLIFTIFSYGCDSTVNGVTFESGFMVPYEEAHQYGYEAGATACSTGVRPIAKYKDGTKASAAYSEGYFEALTAICPSRL